MTPLGPLFIQGVTVEEGRGTFIHVPRDDSTDGQAIIAKFRDHVMMRPMLDEPGSRTH